jgi:hypothetical protein
MRKGISAVIATILVLIITVGLAATAWMFVSGVFTARVSTAFSVIDTYANTIIIRNDGTVPITSFNSITVDESPATYLVTPLDRSMVGNWKFDEGAGNTAEDSSGYGNDGTLYNNPTWVDGKYGKALSFDGVDDRIEAPHSDSLAMTQEYTIGAWVYWRGVGSVPPWGNILVKVGPDNYGLWIHEDGYVHHCLTFSGGSRECFNTASGVVPTNEWVYIAGTFDGNNVKTYVNGEVWEWTRVGTLESSTGVLRIGAHSPSWALMNGVIDEVRIYSRALSEEEIKTLYDIGGQINPGSMATIKIYDVLSKGTHAVRICTLTMCQSVYLTIY